MICSVENVKNTINDSDYVLVGIGELFGYDWKLVESDERYQELFEVINEDRSLEWLLPYLQKVTMDSLPDRKLKEAYFDLAKMISEKDYYVITTTIDDYIYQSGINEKRIITPCGGFRKLQCSNNCNKELINIPNALLKYVQNLYNNKISLDEIRDKYPECPDCGAYLVPNQIGIDNYAEEGYLDKWGEYRSWIEKTMNRKLTMLELGAGLGFMSVIRNPFEKLASYNQKATLYRVHPTLYMGTPQMEDRCISIQHNPIEWILNDN